MTILVNRTHIETFNFPGGECSVKVDGNTVGQYTHITAYLFNSDAILKLLLTVDAVRRIEPSTRIALLIPYMPYARQDRVCNTGEALSIKVMANLINGLNCEEVIIYDPHSDVTIALINNCTSVPQWVLLKNLHTIFMDYADTIISPDAGAEKKVREIAKYHAGIREIICATKVRNIMTGEIVSTHVNGDVFGKDVIILDDICDGGRTFTELAKGLSAKGCGKKYLYVTHGIFSKGLDVLKPYFTKVFCYHTFLPKDQIDPEFLTIIGERHVN